MRFARAFAKKKSQRWLTGMFGPTTLNLDIVDYPGEWLLDLPLLSLSFAEWSAQALDRARRPHSHEEAAQFLEVLEGIDPLKDGSDTDAELLAAAFTAYLKDSREDGRALSTLPPGRFLMPGDLEGSPALTFAPVPPLSGPVPGRSLYAMLERRYEKYKDIVVRPFFRDHFARLDRQIVLVDTLRALNAGPAAIADLEAALTDILTCFRQGDAKAFLNLVSRRIDRILFAASKADHIHSSSHDRLEATMMRLVAKAAKRARFAGAETRSLALAAVRATREGQIEEGGERLDVILGTPIAGETLDGMSYDGKTEIALFPGDLPPDPEVLLEEEEPVALKFMRFTPPVKLERDAGGSPMLPHIRLDRALDYLIGDWLR